MRNTGVSLKKICGLIAAACLQGAAAQTPPDTSLRPVSAFASIGDSQTRAAALFNEAGKVLQHPRCVNCHPRTDRPLEQSA